MALTIRHNGIDITKKMDLTKCYVYDRYGGMLDSISMVFPEGLTDFDFYRYDEIEVITDSFKSGVMYVDECILLSGVYTLNAISYKQMNKKKSSGIWKHIRLSQIAKDIADRNGLKLKMYGVKDFVYESLSKINESDLEFLSRICNREGYSIKCDDGNLIIFNEKELENNAIPFDLDASEVNPSYLFKRSTNGISELTVRHFDFRTGKYISYTATDKNIEGGTTVITERVKDVSEAQRFALGRLRMANRDSVVGDISMALTAKISAGTTLELAGFGEFDGKYVVYEVAHDVINENTFLKVRAVLGY